VYQIIIVFPHKIIKVISVPVIRSSQNLELKWMVYSAVYLHTLLKTFTSFPGLKRKSRNHTKHSTLIGISTHFTRMLLFRNKILLHEATATECYHLSVRQWSRVKRWKFIVQQCVVTARRARALLLKPLTNTLKTTQTHIAMMQFSISFWLSLAIMSRFYLSPLCDW